MTQRPFEAETILAYLTGFQRATVEHVMDRFYGDDPTRRFLVADETGLGKSIVARGVIARTIEQLEHDSSVDRIDVVYVCSNADIAQQNIRRLDVTGDPHLPFASRLTLLAKHAGRLEGNKGRSTKPVNLISLTPGTSFETGWQTGIAEERAMIYLMLKEPLGLAGYRATAARRLLQGTVSTVERFTNSIDRLEAEMDGVVDMKIATDFIVAAQAQGLRDEFAALVEEVGRKHTVPDRLSRQVASLVGQLRTTLARVSVNTLEPDLIILDEFQRFRNLLNEHTEEGQLAHHLFNYPGARVLLLSATPYKPFTYAEERQTGDDHHRDFLDTVRFLAGSSSSVSVDAIAANLERYRSAAISGEPTAAVIACLRKQLLQIMCRSERPARGGEAMLKEHEAPAHDLTAEDLFGYGALRAVATATGGQMSVEYWKSAPYFINFMDGYQLAEKVRAAVKSQDDPADVRGLLARTHHIDREHLRTFTQLDMGNAKLRQVAQDTVRKGWWKLLWIPPSLPYFSPGGPYAEGFASTATKRLIFSSWTATPTAVAALLSYEAERCIAEGQMTENSPASRRRAGNRLRYNMDGERPASMTALALFWPMPGLAKRADPLAWSGRAHGQLLGSDAVEAALAEELMSEVPAGESSRLPRSEAWYWAAALQRPDSLPAYFRAPERRGDIMRGLTGRALEEQENADDPAGLLAHVTHALDPSAVENLPPPPDLAKALAMIALHSPGNVAWRALSRIIIGQKAVSPEGHWTAAAILASGLRTLFNRTEATLLLDRLVPNTVYWQAVLRYSAWGNLQAVLDEYIYHLATDEGGGVLNDERLARLAETAASAIGLRPSTYQAFDPIHPEQPLSFTARFALRYGSRRQSEESVRQPEVRRAFNSPFWPFVLATTSVGQEGIDFHWWCHALMHWNTPASPVDFEQREGRIDRYAGHAIRRNIAHHHGEAIRASGAANPWQRAYELATDEVATLGEFAPYWVYPGPAKIERHISPYPLSSDGPRLLRLKNDVALYRLTFGQPRQEDMLELLARRGAVGESSLASMRIDLTPPAIVREVE